MNIHGIGVTVEVPKGATRKGTDPDGKSWATKMPAAYGRIPRTTGADREPIDAYIGPHVKSPKVYVVNQNDAESGDFDEHKVFLGFSSKRQVIRTYMAAFSDGNGGDRLGRVSEMDVPKFKEWLKGDTTEPIKRAEGGPVDKPAFDPSKPFDPTPAVEAKPAFDPSKPFDAPTEQNQFISAVTDVPHEIYEAGRSAIGAMSKMNPFSDEGHQRTVERLKKPALEAMKEQYGDVGSAIMGAPALAGSPVTGAARSLVGHPYSAITGIPYDEAKGAVDLAMSAVAPRGVSPIGARTAPVRPPPVPTAEELHASATDAYRQARATGVEIDPQPISHLAARIESDLADMGLTARNVPETHEIIRTLQNPPHGGVMRAQDFERARQELVAARQNVTNRREGRAANIVIDQLDNYLANIPPAHVIRGDVGLFRDLIGRARGDYAAASRADTTAGKIELGDLNAGTAYSGQNVDNAMRQAIKQLIRPDKNGRTPAQKMGFSEDEIAQMNRVARGTATGNTLRAIGKLAPTDFVKVAGHAALAHQSAGTTIPLSIASFIAKRLGDRGTLRAAERMDEMVRSRSPSYRAAVAAARPAPIAGPSPAAGFVPLTTGAAGMGAPAFGMSSPRILGPVPANAENDQPQ
jgi:hypothetical protein